MPSWYKGKAILCCNEAHPLGMLSGGSMWFLHPGTQLYVGAL